MNKKWHPGSWTEQARQMADYQFEQYLFYKKHPDIAQYVNSHDGRLDEKTWEFVSFWQNDINYYEDFFHCSYRHKIIRERATKRFRRKCRKYGIGRT